MAAEVETYDALIKLILIGNSSVGKTCLILRYVENTYQKNFLPTIGEACLHETAKAALDT